MMHILTAAILYTSAMGVGIFHGHEHQHHADVQVCPVEDGASCPVEHDPCTRMDCDRDACCSMHSHHLLAIGGAVSTDTWPVPAALKLPEIHTPLRDFPRDIFHPPKSV
jgi:hypothetical protein